MNAHTITLISELDDHLQAWTFNIAESDLINLMEKYDGHGVSVTGDADDLAAELKQIYNK